MRIICFILLLLPAVRISAQHPADVSTMDGIVSALYDVISGPAGEARDWDRFRTLFKPEAQLTPIFKRKDVEGLETKYFSVEEFIVAASENVKEDGFFEKETGRQVQQFRDMASIFSAYESRSAVEDEKPFDAGINSIQAMYDGKRWWILNIVWQSADAEHPVPKKLRKKK